jgi:hypothetical protein
VADKIYAAVIAELKKRRREGLYKYGLSMEREDLTMSEWVQHAKEEALDFAVYLQKILTMLDAPKTAKKTNAEMAAEFRMIFQCEDDPLLAELLIAEEFSEFIGADGDVDKLKELTDLLYVAYQYAEVKGWDLDEAYRRVHRSNMSKVGKDGRAFYREDGKVLKGPDYRPPDLRDLVDAE